MPLEELRKLPGIKARYLQVDIKNKCVPIDWFIGFDTFSIYSFVNFVGFGQAGHGGYLKSFLRPGPSGFLVDFADDFQGLGESHDGIVKHFKNKMWMIYDTLKQLFVLMCCVVAIAKSFVYSLTKNQMSGRVEEFTTQPMELQRRMDHLTRRRPNAD